MDKRKRGDPTKPTDTSPSLKLVQKPTNIKKLQTYEDQERASVVTALEEALAEAKAGNVVAVAISMVAPFDPEKPEQVGYLSSESRRYASQLIASVGLTHFRLCEDMWHSEDNLVTTEEFDPPDDSA